MIDWLVNGLLLAVCFVVAFFFLKWRDENAAKKDREKALAAAAKDNEKVIEKPYTLKELREYDGSDESKPILVAVNYKVYDVTKRRDLYGKKGSYQALAGRDASRALATMDLTPKSISDEWDDLADFQGDDWGSLKDWEQQFMIKYKCFGWLEKETEKDPTEDDGGEQSVVKEVESVGPDQKKDNVDDPMEDDQPQTGDKVDESKPDETQPTEETAQVEDSEEQGHDQMEGNQNEDEEPGNDQTEADDQDQKHEDQDQQHQDQDQQHQDQDQQYQDQQHHDEDQQHQDQDQQHHDEDQQHQDQDQQHKDQDQDQQHQDQDQQHQDQSSEAKEESEEPVGENQEGDKNEEETSQGDQEQDENSV